MKMNTFAAADQMNTPSVSDNIIIFQAERENELVGTINQVWANGKHIDKEYGRGNTQLFI